MKIWIDLANAPQVLFFVPLIAEIRKRGIETVLSARDFAETPSLARLHGLTVIPVGRHGGRTAAGKAWAIASRAVELRRIGRRERPDLAVSHNSYAHCVAAKSLGVRCVTIMDYEHTPANHVSFRLADRVVLPSAVPFTAVRKYGAKPSKIVRYDGFKEQVYLDGFHPNGRPLDGLPLEMWDQFVVVVARPPAEFAIYHRFKNPLFERWLERAGRQPEVRVVALPRTSEQGERLKQMRLPSVIVPASPLRGADLVARADLVVSAGGTMNREAAVLGVPAYSLFGGAVAAVDRALEGLGRLTFVRNEHDLDTIRLEKKGPSNPLRNPGLVARLVDNFLER